MTVRMFLKLSEEEAGALVELATNELRQPGDQARLLLRQALTERGLLGHQQAKQESEPTERYNLESTQSEFAEVRATEAQPGDRNDFAFEGAKVVCDLDSPHLPHVVGTYDSTRYGRLVDFCLGQEGEIPNTGNKLHIVLTQHTSGVPAFPAKAQGYWFVTE